MWYLGLVWLGSFGLSIATSSRLSCKVDSLQQKFKVSGVYMIIDIDIDIFELIRFFIKVNIFKIYTWSIIFLLQIRCSWLFVFTDTSHLTVNLMIYFFRLKIINILRFKIYVRQNNILKKYETLVPSA